MPKVSNKQLDYIGSHFDEFQKNGQGYKALCPVHDDNTPSLCLDRGNNGGVLIHCQAGCPTRDVLDFVGGLLW